MDADTTLSDLLALELHNHEEEVKNIVDKASKEMSMEKILKDLNSIWAELQFQLEEHPRTKLLLLKISDEAIETLEENQVNRIFSAQLKLVQGGSIAPCRARTFFFF
jgi:dynein heavy chain